MINAFLCCGLSPTVNCQGCDLQHECNIHGAFAEAQRQASKIDNVVLRHAVIGCFHEIYHRVVALEEKMSEQLRDPGGFQLDGYERTEDDPEGFIEQIEALEDEVSLLGRAAADYKEAHDEEWGDLIEVSKETKDEPVPIEVEGGIDYRHCSNCSQAVGIRSESAHHRKKCPGCGMWKDYCK